MKQVYFVSYLIEGKTREWHLNLTKNISEIFNTWKIAEKIPPHITIFRPFDTENIESIYELIQNWKANQAIFGKFIISGFGRFEDQTIFANVIADQTAGDAINSLRLKLQNMPGMPPEDHPIWRPHATLAYKIKPAEINAIWEYISTLQKPHFEMTFNNIAILQSTGDRGWTVFKKLGW